MNCWEFKKCPPERRDSCPAYPDRGRDCWRVTGTMCGGVKQADLHTKLEKCRECTYYQSGYCQTS